MRCRHDIIIIWNLFVNFCQLVEVVLEEDDLLALSLDTDVAVIFVVNSPALNHHQTLINEQDTMKQTRCRVNIHQQTTSDTGYRPTCYAT